MTLKKSEIVERYGEAAWERVLARNRAGKKKYREKNRETNKKYREANPEQVEKIRLEQARKGGKYYEQRLEHQRTGIPGEKEKIRAKHGAQYRPLKKIIAPESQIHHEWIPKTAEYRGLALVEKDPHQYGIIDVIQILDGKITLLTEEDVKNGEKKKEVKK